MAESPSIIIPRVHQAGRNVDVLDIIAEEAAKRKEIPIRIKCPECQRIYTLYIADFNQGLHTLLGQACPFCKRFIKETDNPEEVLADLPEIRSALKEEQNG